MLEAWGYSLTWLPELAESDPKHRAEVALKHHYMCPQNSHNDQNRRDTAVGGSAVEFSFLLVWGAPDSTQGFLLTVHSGISSGSAWTTSCGAGNLNQDQLRARQVPSPLYYLQPLEAGFK